MAGPQGMLKIFKSVRVLYFDWDELTPPVGVLNTSIVGCTTKHLGSGSAVVMSQRERPGVVALVTILPHHFQECCIG